MAIGYLFLLSVPDFIFYIYSNSLDVKIQIAVSIALILFTYGFIMLNIQKRVKPDLFLPQLLLRGGHLLFIAAGYAAVGLFFVEKVLFMKVYSSSAFQYKIESLTVSDSQLMLCASISLVIGVSLQLIWEEKPVTEPL